MIFVIHLHLVLMEMNYVDNQLVAKVVNVLFVRYSEYFVHRRSNKSFCFGIRKEIFDVDLLLKMPMRLEMYLIGHWYFVDYSQIQESKN
jgi:spore coat polysaccharide biosynthesis protein SpsF (cytidylyltransferase family)